MSFHNFSVFFDDTLLLIKNWKSKWNV